MASVGREGQASGAARGVPTSGRPGERLDQPTYVIRKRHRRGTAYFVAQYELQPTEQGTRVIESRHAENGAKPLANFAVNAFFGGVPSFERELVEGMNASLARIKAAAESG